MTTSKYSRNIAAGEERLIWLEKKMTSRDPLAPFPHYWKAEIAFCRTALEAIKYHRLIIMKRRGALDIIQDLISAVEINHNDLLDDAMRRGRRLLADVKRSEKQISEGSL